MTGQSPKTCVCSCGRKTSLLFFNNFGMCNKCMARRVCQCGRVLTGEDRSFWGECPECRGHLPLHTSAGNGTIMSDLRYHGGQFQRGEW